MIKAVIEYKDGTKMTVKKKSYIELADYMENERENGAIGYEAKGDGGTIQGREYRPGRRAVRAWRTRRINSESIRIRLKRN